MKLWGLFALTFITKPHHKRNVGVSADLVENSGGATFLTASRAATVRESMPILLKQIPYHWDISFINLTI
jgi:hypothetical protein